MLIDGSITATGGTITTVTGGEQSKPTNVQDNSLLVEKDTARRYWFSPQTVDTEEAFSFTTTDTVNALWGNRIYGMKLLSGHSGLNKYIKKIKTYHPTNPTGSRLTTGTLYHVILDSSGTEIARSAGVSASSVSNNTYAETTLSSPVKLLENYTVGVTISTGSGSSYLGTSINNNSSSPTNTTRYYKDESGTVTTSTSETIIMVFDSDPATGLSIPATWINEFGITNGLMFGGVSTSSYANFSDSQSWNGVSWTAGGSLTGARQRGASAGTGSTSARYVNGYNDSPAPYPNSNRNESYNGTAWTSDTVHPQSVNNKSNGGCGTVDSMIVTGGHQNGTGDVNNYYKWTGSWTSIAQGITGSGGSISGTLTSALMTKSTSAQTWNGSSWTSSTATSTSRTFSPASGTSSTSGFRVFGTYANPFISTSESWNGTAWTARGSAPASRVEAGCIPASTDSMMTLGGQQYYGASGSALYSTDVYEYRKGTFTTGASFSNGRRSCGGAGS